MTTTSALAQAIERHKAAQAAVDAVADNSDGCPDHLREEENEALDELAWTPCASDAEFLEKLRYLYSRQAGIWTCRTMATIMAVSSSPPHATSGR
jgi:hypothetical protein